MQETIEKYDGIFEVKPKDTVFTAEVLLPYPENNSHEDKEAEADEKAEINS